MMTLVLRRVASTAVAPARVHRGARAMTILSYKQGEGKKHESAAAKQPERQEAGGGAESREVTPRKPAQAAASFTSPEVLPFRRMVDAMSAMQREMDAMMGSFGLGLDAPLFAPRPPFALLDSLAAGDLLPAPLAGRGPRLSRMVPLEVEEDEHKYTVRAEVPGFTKADIKVTLDPATNMVTITGQRHTSGPTRGTEAGGEAVAGEKAGAVQASISFTRSFTLPQDVDADQPLVARTEHGILTLELPKVPAKEAPGVKEIPVQ